MYRNGKSRHNLNSLFLIVLLSEAILVWTVGGGGSSCETVVFGPLPNMHTRTHARKHMHTHANTHTHTKIQTDSHSE